MSKNQYKYIIRQFTDKHTIIDKNNFINEMINRFPQARMTDFTLTKSKNNVETWTFKYDSFNNKDYWDPNLIIGNHS